jgi:hypothetical protein
MIPLPRLAFEFYVRLWGEANARLIFFPAPLGVL